MYLVTLPSLLSRLSDPTDPGGPQITCGTKRPTDAEGDLDGDFRQFPQSQTQLVARDSLVKTFPIVFAAIDPAQLSQLRAWQGHTVCLRTYDGYVYFGGFLRLQEHLYPRSSIYDATCSDFQLVTYP